MAWNVKLPPAEWYEPGEHGLDALVNEIKATKRVAIDTETTGLNIVTSIPLFWSLAWESSNGLKRRVCMPSSTLPFFKDCFRDPYKDWLLANAKYDNHILANVGCELMGHLLDTQVMHALIYEEKPHGLKPMCQEILGWKWTDFTDTFGKLKKGESYQDILMKVARENRHKLQEYASNDAFGTLELGIALEKELRGAGTFSLYPEDFSTMWDIFIKTEMPFTKVLWHCERNGVKVDLEYLDSLNVPVTKEIGEIEREANRVHYDICGKTLNLSSPSQLAEYFFQVKKLKPIKFTKGGASGIKKPSVDYDFLDRYKNEDPIAKLAILHRDLSKLKGTYLEGLQEAADQNSRIHTRFNQDTARTGRLSSADPNMQNIPNPDSDRFKVRKAFIPEDGNDLLVLDYQALEMRLLAAASQEPRMCEIFKRGWDIHMGNAAMVFGPLYKQRYGFDMAYEDIEKAKKIDKKVKEGELPPEAITKEVEMCLLARGRAKTVGFGLNYGMKEGKLSRDLGITKEEAVELIDQYLNTYPAVKQFYREAIAETQDTLYAFSLLGRRRYLPEIWASDDLTRWGAERKAVNMEIQGTAADAVRLAMIQVYNANLYDKYGCSMLLQVHDELVFECPKETSKECLAEIKEIMEHPFKTDLDVPLTVSGGIGPNWSEAK